MKKWIYRHYKWNLYEVIWLSKHSETLEEFVVYKPLYESKKYNIDFWVRPINLFSEEITIDWKKINRFEYIGDKKYENI